MRVLVTGAGGQLGHDVVAAVRRGGRRRRRDRSRRARRDRAVRRGGAVAAIRPDVVIHCAAWTAVDDCEGDPDRAFAVNADAVRWVREASELVGAHLLTISTDYVFDGTLDRPYHERDTPNPRRCTAARSSPARRGAAPDGDDRAHVVGLRRARLEHGADGAAPGSRARRPGVRRRPARLPDVHGRSGADAAPPRPRAPRRASIT